MAKPLATRRILVAAARADEEIDSEAGQLCMSVTTCSSSIFAMCEAAARWLHSRELPLPQGRA